MEYWEKEKTLIKSIDDDLNSKKLCYTFYILDVTFLNENEETEVIKKKRKKNNNDNNKKEKRW